MSRYPANRVAPLTLQVPVVCLRTGWLLFDETLGPLHWAGGALLMLGLLVHVQGPSVWRLVKRISR